MMIGPCYALDDKIPQIADNAFIAPGARLIGDVTMDNEASVWFNAVLRGDNERITLRARANVQDNCVLHTDPGFPLMLGEDVTVGHSAIVHGCEVGAGALIGMGATILNGAHIGPGALIGAGALVGEGKEIPPGVLALGAPAKVIRKLSDQEINIIRGAALRYARNNARYRAGLRGA